MIYLYVDTQMVTVAYHTHTHTRTLKVHLKKTPQRSKHIISALFERFFEVEAFALLVYLGFAQGTHI